MGIKTDFLDNGVKVSTYSFPSLETVGIAIGVRYGSVDENPKINGSAHFLEHMLFKGTKRRTWKDINEEVKELGAYQNAFTDREMTIYLTQTYKKYASKGMDIISDAVTSSTIPEKEFELERGPIINENLMREDNPQSLFDDYMPLVLFKNHPAKMPIGGNNELTIKKITRDHLYDIYLRNYSPENTILSICGGISYKSAMDLANKYLGDFKRPYEKKKRKIAREKQVRKDLVIWKKGIKQTRIGIGFKCAEFSKDRISEYASMIVINGILRDRIFEEVREKRGLSYDPYSSYNCYGTFGFIAAECGTEPKKASLAKDVILREFEKMQNGEIKKDELQKMKRSLAVKYLTKKERSLDFATSMAISELTLGDPSIPERLPGMVSKVGIDNVRKYAGKYIDVDRYAMVMLKPA